MNSKESILVLAPHPDDETLGCGGFLLKKKQEGAGIHWVIGTQMTSPAYTEQQITRRHDVINQVAQLFQFDSVHQLPYPAAGLDQIPQQDIVQKLGEIVKETQATVMLLPNRSDIHSDHPILFQCGLSVSKWFRYPSVKSVMMVEVLSETDFAAALPESAFLPNVFYDITPFLDKKLEIMRCFQSEIHPHPFPRNEEAVRAQAILRGVQAGCRYAEGFLLVKEIR